MRNSMIWAKILKNSSVMLKSWKNQNGPSRAKRSIRISNWPMSSNNLSQTSYNIISGLTREFQLRKLPLNSKWLWMRMSRSPISQQMHKVKNSTIRLRDSMIQSTDPKSMILKRRENMMSRTRKRKRQTWPLLKCKTSTRMSTCSSERYTHWHEEANRNS